MVYAYELGIVAFIAGLVGLVVWIVLRDPTDDGTATPVPESTATAAPDGTNLPIVTPPNNNQPQETTFWSENAAIIGGATGGIIFAILVMVLVYRNRGRVRGWFGKAGGEAGGVVGEAEDLSKLKKRKLKKTIKSLEKELGDLNKKVEAGVLDLEDDVARVTSKLEEHKQEAARRESGGEVAPI